VTIGVKLGKLGESAVLVWKMEVTWILKSQQTY